jgi:HYR domain/Subtilase family
MSKRGFHGSWPLVALVAFALAASSRVFAEEVGDAARRQILALEQQKASRTPAQRKMDSQLIYSAHPAALRLAAPDMEADVQLVDGRVLVDVAVRQTPDPSAGRRARPVARLQRSIEDLGGTIVSAFPQFATIRAWLPLGSVEGLAADPDVAFVERAAEMMTNTGSVNGQGDARHRAAATRTLFAVTGAGITVGVLSDSEDNLAGAQASLDIGAVNVVASGINTCGATGTSPCTGEGTAMMEIVTDLAPGAALAFATANGGPAQFAANILALQAAGATVIVDDVTYFNESPFQDGPISQAVNTVSGAGVLYFSSARNSGNLNDGTAGTWEGDFSDGGAVAAPVPGSGRIHSFGASNFDTVAAGGGPQRRVDLFWADPLGGSGNDYDLYVLNSTGTSVLRSSTNSQTGSQNPYESTGTLNVGERIVIVRANAAANRFLHLDTGRAVLTIATNGNVRGHNASGAANAYSVAATDVANSVGAFTGGATNPVETFSSDGPRRMFFDPAGNPFTPGNFTSTGGIVLQKPDITAADGNASSAASSPRFNPFFGTSAAAPHAAAIAALMRSFTPAPTPAQIRAALNGSALDIEAAGFDRDSGVGIVMAFGAMKIISPCTVTCAANVTTGNDPNQCGAVTSFGAPTLAGTCGTVTCAPPSGSFFPVGTTPVLCQTQSEDSCSFNVTVNDGEAPTIVCPANQTSPNDPGLCSAVVSYPAPTVTDNCPGTGAAVCAPPSGSVFPKGTTSVSCSVSDAASNPSSCSFSVTVRDTEAPKLSCAVGTSRLWPPNHNLVNVGLTASATDNCPGALPITVRVFGDEDDEMPTGDGHFSPDAKDIAPGTLRLRSERRGDADGRVYLDISKATDTSGNTGFACCTVGVPHSRSGGAIQSIDLQTAAAQSYCAVHGAAPAGYFVVGDGPIIGPKQ